MRRLDQRGIAAVTVVVIIAVSAGGAVATPVIVDVADVDPDHPLYGLERIGERIRMIGDEDQMKERWGEYVRLVDRGKGLEYKNILEEFVEKMREVAPGDVAAKQEVVRWMQEQMPGIGLVKLKLQKELLQGLKEDLPEISDEIDDLIDEIENCEPQLRVPELRENARARMRLIREKLENLAERHRGRIRRPVNVYFHVDNVLVDVDITVNVEINITIERPPITVAKFDEKLEEFNELLAEVQAMLEGTPENTIGRRAAERLVEVAIRLKDKAVDAYEAGKVRRALTLIYAAKIHLYNAKRILEHASEWEPMFKNEWMRWRQDLQRVKEKLEEEGITWEDIKENYEQYKDNLSQTWEGCC
jgi:ElaB/YqjD/DUF883 family membrane-anchored ribosome-binding protein